MNRIASCIYTKKEGDPSNMIKLVLGPSNTIYFDLKQNLPGEFLYITNSKEILTKAINEAIITNEFKKILQINDAKEIIIPINLLDIIEKQYFNFALQTISLGKKSGNLLLGKRQIDEFCGSNKIENLENTLIIQAYDASMSEKFNKDGKIEIIEIFSRDDLSKACGKENLVYALIQHKFAVLLKNIIAKHQNYIRN